MEILQWQSEYHFVMYFLETELQLPIVTDGTRCKFQKMDYKSEKLKNYCRDGLGMFSHKIPSVLSTHKADQISMKMLHGLAQYGVMLTNFKLV